MMRRPGQHGHQSPGAWRSQQAHHVRVRVTARAPAPPAPRRRGTVMKIAPMLAQSPQKQDTASLASRSSDSSANGIMGVFFRSS